jgi:hypothetical protein
MYCMLCVRVAIPLQSSLTDLVELCSIHELRRILTLTEDNLRQIDLFYL